MIPYIIQEPQAEWYSFDLHFLPSREENFGVAAVETGGKQMSTGHLHFDGFKSLFITTKIKKTPGWVSSLFGGDGGI